MIKVRCKSNERESVADKACAMFVSRTADGLVVGETYVVFGQCLYQGCLLLLLNPSLSRGYIRPTWYPESLFEVVENTIPEDWIYRHFPERDFGDVTALWGYAELVTSKEHYIGLMESEPEALKIFSEYQFTLVDHPKW